MWRTATALVVLAAVATVLVGAGAVDGDFDDLTGGDKMRAVLDAVVSCQRSTTSLDAEFVQTKESDLLLEPVVSRGRFRYLASSKVRWDYAEPEPMVVLFCDSTLLTYFPDQQRAEQAKVGSRQRRFVRFLGGTQPLDELIGQFRLVFRDPGDEARYELTLEPVASIIRNRLDGIDLEIDRQLLLPVLVEYREVDGDVTRYEFSRVQRNVPLAESLFELELGADVTVETVAADVAPIG